MMAAFPLMVVPLALYNMAMIGLFGGHGIAALDGVIVSLPMLSGAVWTMRSGDLLIVVALVMLFLEIVKASRNSAGSLMNHMLSIIVFVAFLVEFLLVQGAATQIFFILMTITFIDVIGGFVVSLRTAGRDISIGGL